MRSARVRSRNARSSSRSNSRTAASCASYSSRLDAAVPSDDLASLRVGAPVRFEVRGYAEPLEGTIERIAPQADPTTRQVPIYVAIPNVGGRLVAGLFAEGRVIAESVEGLVVPVVQN